jgi:hypothetical protein
MRLLLGVNVLDTDQSCQGRAGRWTIFSDRYMSDYHFYRSLPLSKKGGDRRPAGVWKKLAGKFKRRRGIY